MLPNLSVIWVIVLLLVLTMVINRLLLRPVLEVIRKREEAINSARDLAKKSADEARAASEELDRKTTAARALFEGAPSPVPADDLEELHIRVEESKA